MVRWAARLDGYGGMGGAGRRLARGTVRRFDLDQHRAAKGLPPTGVRGLLQDRSPPHICDASRARACRAGMSTGRAQVIHSVKSKVRTYHLTLSVITGLVPVIPIRKALRLTASGWPGQARP
jgi:hypothetical protein